jgi:hypothetical protein
MYITGYYLDGPSQTLFLYRNNEETHFETRQGVPDEKAAMQIIDFENAAAATPTPTPIPNPTPTPIPTPTPTPNAEQVLENTLLKESIEEDKSMPDDFNDFEPNDDDDDDELFNESLEEASALEVVEPQKVEVKENEEVSVLSQQAAKVTKRVHALLEAGFTTSSAGYSKGDGLITAEQIRNLSESEWADIFIASVEKQIEDKVSELTEDKIVAMLDETEGEEIPEIQEENSSEEQEIKFEPEPEQHQHAKAQEEAIIEQAQDDVQKADTVVSKKIKTRASKKEAEPSFSRPMTLVESLLQSIAPLLISNDVSLNIDFSLVDKNEALNIKITPTYKEKK